MRALKISDTYIPEEKIKFIARYDGRVSVKLVAEKKKEKKCFDITHGKAAKSFIMLMDDSIILCPLEAATLYKRLTQNNK